MRLTAHLNLRLVLIEFNSIQFNLDYLNKHFIIIIIVIITKNVLI